jgi:hypothetical protein
VPVLTNLNRCLQGLLPCTLLVVDFVGMSTAFSLLLAAKVTSWPNAQGLAHEGVIIEDLTLDACCALGTAGCSAVGLGTREVWWLLPSRCLFNSRRLLLRSDA